MADAGRADWHGPRGSGQMTDGGVWNSFRLGVNYWPARTAMSWWDDVRFAEIDHDIARIADLGLQEARIFLLWETFQPRPDGVSDGALLERDRSSGGRAHRV